MPHSISSSGHQIPSAYRHVSRSGNESTPKEASESSETRRPETNASIDELDLGDDLSAAEKEMIADRFPPAPEKQMQIYGRGRQEQQMQTDQRGRQLDVQG